MKVEPGYVDLSVSGADPVRVSVPVHGSKRNGVRVSMSTELLKARFELMNSVVFPAMAERTNDYAKKVCEQFMKRHKIFNDDYPQGALVMKQVLTRASKATPG